MDIIGCKRDSPSASVYFSFSLIRRFGVSHCTPAATKEMRAKNTADVSSCKAPGFQTLMPTRCWRGINVAFNGRKREEVNTVI